VVEPPHRLVLTWVWDHEPDNAQLIELEFTEREDGTSVLMTQQRHPHGRPAQGPGGGWNRCYDNLEHALATPSF
jgi:uncharacterized protein YndB with AHSA1/START domain